MTPNPWEVGDLYWPRLNVLKAFLLRIGNASELTRYVGDAGVVRPRVDALHLLQALSSSDLSSN